MAENQEPNISGRPKISKDRLKEARAFLKARTETEKQKFRQRGGNLEAGSDRYFRETAYGKTRQQRVIDQLKKLSRTDALTGLPNRRWFEEELPRRIAQAKRQKTPLAILFIDLDNFKDFNTFFGHSGGDSALKLVANLPTRLEEPFSRVAKENGEENGEGERERVRLAGDEFVEILHGITEENIEVVINRYRERIKEASRAMFEKAPTREGVGREDAPLEITLSFGAAFLHGNETPSEFLRRANLAMLRAKELGKDVGVVARTSQDPENLYTFDVIPKQ